MSQWIPNVWVPLFGVVGEGADSLCLALNDLFDLLQRGPKAKFYSLGKYLSIYDMCF